MAIQLCHLALSACFYDSGMCDQQEIGFDCPHLASFETLCLISVGFLHLTGYCLGLHRFSLYHQGETDLLNALLKLAGKFQVYAGAVPPLGPVILPILVMVKMNILMYPFYRRQEIFGNNLLHTFLNRIREMVSFELGKEIEKEVFCLVMGMGR